MKSKNFIAKSECLGRSEALKIFIKNNLRYHKESLPHNIEGSIFLDMRLMKKAVLINI
tara:strand:- start:321 stop:494 length:174 start_codon:yes stop_codon:yes gene_type:complete